MLFSDPPWCVDEELNCPALAKIRLERGTQKISYATSSLLLYLKRDTVGVHPAELSRTVHIPVRVEHDWAGGAVAVAAAGEIM